MNQEHAETDAHGGATTPPEPTRIGIEALRRSQSGMTLIEIMVVITILGILGTLITVNVLNSVNKAKSDTTKVQIEGLRTPLQRFYLDHGRYPSTSEGLEALIRPPAGRNGRKFNSYLEKDQVPVDGWGQPFQYFSPGSNGNHPYEIISMGADGKEGGEGNDGDVVSWE